METMTQKDKDLLIKDLCARLPYGVKVEYKNEIFDVEHVSPMYEEVKLDTYETWTIGVTDIKPYLFPLSSITEEQKRELLELTGYEARCEEDCGFDSWGFYVNIVGEYKYEDGEQSIILYPDDIGIDWLIKNHFDYRGLIERGLALDATGLDVY